MDCVQEIVSRSGVDADDALDILEQVNAERQRLAAEADVDAIDRRLMDFARGMGDEAEADALARQRRVAQNILLRERWDGRMAALEAEGIKDPRERLMAILAGTHKGVEGGRVSTSQIKADLELRWSGKILSRIEAERPHVWALVKKDEEFMDDVVREMFNLDTPNHTPGSPDARWLAEVLAESSDQARVRLNRAGTLVRKLRNWVPQRHDSMKILQAGRENWKRHLLENDLLDMERTFPNMSFDQAVLALDSVYDTLVRGFNMDKPANFADMSLSGPANLADQLARKHRVLHFKGPDEWMNYAETFGIGNVFDTVLGHLRETAQQAANLETMGPNPQAFMERYVARVREQIWENPNLTDAQKRKQADKLPRDFWGKPNNPLQMMFDVVTGRTDRPERVTFARVSSGVRAWTSMSKLGMAVISSITDLSTAAARMRTQDVPLLDGYARMLGGLFEGRRSAEKKELSYLLGVGFDGMLGDIHSRFMAEDHVYGKLSKAQQVFFKISGLTDYTERMRSTFGLMSSANMAQRTTLPWDQLSDRYRHNLEVHGIGEAEWKAVQALEKRGADGRDYVIPEAARMLPDSVIDDLIAPEMKKAEAYLTQKLEADAASLKKLRQDYLDRGPQTVRDNLNRYFKGGAGRADGLSPEQLAKALQKSWADLDDAYRPRLDRHGVVAGNWESLRGLVREQDGVRRVVPEAIMGRRPMAVSAITTPHLAEVEGAVRTSRRGKVIGDMAQRRDRLRSEGRARLEDRLRQYFVDETDYGVIRPDDRTRVWQTAGAKPGTLLGEAVRFMMQFKSFPIAFSQRVLGPHLYGGRNSGADYAGLAHIIAASTMLGYLAMSTKDVFKGREPRDPTKAATWAAAFMQGGGAGIYGDFLLGKYSRFGDSPLKSIEGPTLNVADDLVKFAVNALHGEFDGGDLIYLGINNTPFVNLFYTRQALDWAVIYHLQELASPGYLRRQQRRMKKEYNQEHIIPPTRHIRRGGGWK